MKILIVSTSQFGYLVDYHRYYSYLKRSGHSVTFVCWDFDRTKVEEGNPDIVYVSRSGSKRARLGRFLDAVVALEKRESFDRIMVNWFKFATVLLWRVPRKKVYIDIRTVSVDRSKLKQKLFDTWMRFDASAFGRVSILTDASARRLGIKKYKLLPLGGAYFLDDQRPVDKRFSDLLATGELDFLYVGTLHMREIIKCVIGFHGYIKKHPAVNTRFIIIGDAIQHELVEIRKYVADHHLEEKVITLGYIPQNQLPLFFKKVFCGVSFVPILPHFYVQPSTKTYEYLVNGVPVIGTAIQDNVRLLSDSSVPCGLVINDNAAEFEKAVAGMIANKDLYDKRAIAEKFSEYEWDHLFRKYLDDVLDLPAHKQQMTA